MSGGDVCEHLRPLDGTCIECGKYKEVCESYKEITDNMAKEIKILTDKLSATEKERDFFAMDANEEFHKRNDIEFNQQWFHDEIKNLTEEREKYKQELEKALEIIDRRDKMILELNTKQHTFRDLAGRLLNRFKEHIPYMAYEYDIKLIKEAEEKLKGEGL